MAKTPLWFKEWEANTFLHFKMKMEWRTKVSMWLSSVIIATLVGGLVYQIFWG